MQPKFKSQSQINIFCRNNGKHGQGTQSTKMGADSLAKNTLNASTNFSPICLPKPKSLGFLKRSSLCVSVVRDSNYLHSDGSNLPPLIKIELTNILRIWDMYIFNSLKLIFLTSFNLSVKYLRIFFMKMPMPSKLTIFLVLSYE